jgi:hypothetical protein
MNFISIPTKNLPYKKMPGYLKARKIDPDLIAVSIFDNGQKYVPINWKNYLYFGHKIAKIVLCKIDNLYIFVGYSNDDKSIIYNNSFSEIILSQEINHRLDKTIVTENNSTYVTKSNMLQINTILDFIGQFGVSALSNDKLEQLKELSKK